MTISVHQKGKQYLLLTPLGQKHQIELNHFSPEYLSEHQLISNVAEGRGKVYFFEANNLTCVLRHYFRGGLAAKLSRDNFAFSSVENSRCYQELTMLNLLTENSLNVPKAVGARVVRSAFSYQADIITQAIPNCRELHELLQCEPIANDQWQNIGAQIRKMHDLQVCHDDLNVKNVLINNKQDVFLIDFDKCAINQNKGWKQANLDRFLRSINKQQKKYSDYYFTDENWQALLAGYKGVNNKTT